MYISSSLTRCLAFEDLQCHFRDTRSSWNQKRPKNKGLMITDGIIQQFIWQCPCFHVMNRLRITINTHPFVQSLRGDLFGPLKVDDKGHQYILVLIDAFSRWVELFPTTSVSALAGSALLQQSTSTEVRPSTTSWLRNSPSFSNPHRQRYGLPQ